MSTTRLSFKIVVQPIAPKKPLVKNYRVKKTLYQPHTNIASRSNEKHDFTLLQRSKYYDLELEKWPSALQMMMDNPED